jgi:hypothetical protein
MGSFGCLRRGNGDAFVKLTDGLLVVSGSTSIFSSGFLYHSHFDERRHVEYCREAVSAANTEMAFHRNALQLTAHRRTRIVRLSWQLS